MTKKRRVGPPSDPPKDTGARAFHAAHAALAATWNVFPARSRRRRRLPDIQRGHLYLADLRCSSRSAEWIVPVLVLQPDHLNRFRFPSAVVVPCTDDGVPDNALRVRVPDGLIPGRRAYACMINGVRMLNAVRFRKALGRVPPSIVEKVARKVRRLIGP